MTARDEPRTYSDADLWQPSNPPWGAVRAVFLADEFAFVLDDSTGVNIEVELFVYRRRPDGWVLEFNQWDVGLPEGANTHGGGWSYGYGWNYGRDLPGARVVIDYRGKQQVILADENGWWAFIREANDEGIIDDNDEIYDVPARVR
jgi:hypothetical protein